MSSFESVVRTGAPTFSWRAGCPFNSIDTSAGFEAVVQPGPGVDLNQWLASWTSNETIPPGEQTSCDDGMTKDPDASDTTSGVLAGHLKSQTATPAIGPPFVSLRMPRIGGVANGAGGMGAGIGADGAVGGDVCRLHATQPTAKTIARKIFITPG